MIDLQTKYLDEVKRILCARVPECEVRAFGSRVNGMAKEYSDLDLAVVGKGKVEWRRMEDMRDAFSESDLPITVDVLDWRAISPEFRNVIEKDYEVLQKPTSKT